MTSIGLSALLCCYTTDSAQDVLESERLRAVSRTNTRESIQAATQRLQQARQAKRSLKRVQAIRNIYLTPYDKARKGFLEKEIRKAERKIESAKLAMTAGYLRLYKLRIQGTL